MKYHVEIRHLTALQKRLAPHTTDRPFAVVDEDNNVLDRFRTKSGAEACAVRRSR
jgi:hypothetical protein